MKTRNKWVLALALMVVAGACNGGEREAARKAPETSPGPPELTSIEVGLLPTIGVSPFYVAFQDKLFQNEGLETVQPKVAVTGVTEALIGGEFDIVYAAYVVPFQARGQGLPVTIVAAADQVPANIEPDQETVGVVVLPDSPIRGPKDLVGRKIGVPTVAIGQVFLLPDLKKKGVDVNKVELVEVFFPQMLQTLERRSVDAIFAPEPLYSQARATLNVRRVYNPFIGLKEPFPIAGYFTTTEFASKNPNTVRAFRRAIERASKLVNDDWNRAAKVMPLFIAITEEQARKLLPASFATSLEVRHLQLEADTMSDLGLLGKKLNVSEFISK